MAPYRLLTDHYIGGVYLQAGTTVTEGVEVPSGWLPSIATDPIDNDAINKFFAEGPRGQSDAEPNRSLGPWFSGTRWSGIGIGPPSSTGFVSALSFNSLALALPSVSTILERRSKTKHQKSIIQQQRKE